MRRRTSTTRLPAVLKEQIDKEAGGCTPRRWRPKQATNRKNARKQERQEQKYRKAAFFSHPKYEDSSLNHKRLADSTSELDLSRPDKKPRITVSHTDSSKPNVFSTRDDIRSADATSNNSGLNISGKVHRLNVPDRKPPPKEIPQRPREEDPEDAHIAWLESKLSVAQSKSGKKKSIFFGDGLDDLMNDIDRIVPMAAEKLQKCSESESSGESEASDFEGFEGLSTVEDFYTSSAPVELHESDSEVIEGAVLDHNTQEREANNTASEVASTELRAATRYVPPHLRQRSDDGSETLTKLSRQLKGLLNRLSEQNIASILTSIEQLYRTHRRNDITTTLTDLMIDGIASHSSLLDSFVVLHASLVASLYKTTGVELAAHFVQSLVGSYEDNYRSLMASQSQTMNDEVKGKECLNLMVLLSELYNFQVVSCTLIYDIIRSLLETLNEFDVELLLKIVRNSGQQLRQDDPSALKDIIQMVHAKMNTKEQSTISSRTRFMIESLTNLKNNKAKWTVTQDGRLEAADRMKKFLSGLNRKHHVLAHEPLRVTLDDLHSSEKKGKWWLVGSAWGGDPLLDRAQDADLPAKANDLAKDAAGTLAKLARNQRMNTDVRRSIFVVLMASDDYVDACERLSQLSLTDIQQREIVRVNLRCLENERLYNPFYTLVVQRLIQSSHSHKVTLQFCLWDFLRSIEGNSIDSGDITTHTKQDDSHIAFDVRKVSSMRLLNVARAYAWWLAKGCLSLTILKPVDFAALRSQSLQFFRALFSHLFISTQVASPMIAPDEEGAQHFTGSRHPDVLEEIFVKATRVPVLTRGLLYFLTTSLREDESNSPIVSEMLKWAREVAKDALRAGMNVEASLT